MALTLLRSSKFGGAAVAGGIADGVGIAAFGNTVRRSPKARNAELATKSRTALVERIIIGAPLGV